MGVGLIMRILRLHTNSRIDLSRPHTAPIFSIAQREKILDQGRGKEEEEVPQRSGERFFTFHVHASGSCFFVG